MGIPSHDHCDLRILHPYLALIQDVHETMEVNLVKTSPTRKTV